MDCELNRSTQEFHKTDLYAENSGSPVDDIHAIEESKRSLNQPDDNLSHEDFRNVDSILKDLGQPGRFAILVACVLTLNMLTVAPNHAIGVFIAYSPAHACHPFGKQTTPENANASYALDGTSRNQTMHPINITSFQCSASYVHENGEEIVQVCDRQGQWEYKVDEDETSSVTEWDLVCDHGYMANLANTCYYIGVMVGGFLLGYISDVLGRKVSLLVSITASAAVGVAIVLNHNLTAFFVLRFLMGIAIQGVQTSTYIRLVEMFTPKHRSLAVTSYNILWGGSLVLLGFQAWLIKDWRLIQLALIGQAAAASVYLWFVPESLRWLVSQQRTKQASELVRRINKFNGVTCSNKIPNNSSMNKSTSDKTNQRASYFDLLKTHEMRRRTLLMSYLSFATNMGYWGLTYNTTAMVGNKYLNFCLGSIAETVMSVLNVFIIERFGKKKALVAYCITSAISCFILSSLLQVDTSQTVVVMVTVVSSLGRLASAGLFVANDLYMAELFPTVIRNMGMGVCTFMGRIGAVFTPIVFTLQLYTFQQLPLILFGSVTIGGAIVTYVLPETGKLTLPETLADITIIVKDPNDKKERKTMLNSKEQPL